MASKFNEDNVTEKMCIEVAQQAGYTYVEADKLRDDKSAVIVDSILQEALIRINGITTDEAHRTQEGDLGERMRLGLPNAFFFGLTGTPINRTDKNTFKCFGAEEDKGGYMSKYTYQNSIDDGATLNLIFKEVPVELHLDEENLKQAFDRMAEENNLTDEEGSAHEEDVGRGVLYVSKAYS